MAPHPQRAVRKVTLHTAGASDPSPAVSKVTLCTAGGGWGATLRTRPPPPTSTPIQLEQNSCTYNSKHTEYRIHNTETAGKFRRPNQLLPSLWQCELNCEYCMMWSESADRQVAGQTYLWPPPLHPTIHTYYHKVLIYIEHHSVCPLVGIGTPPPL
jgi:hypothetical protein